MKFLLNVLQKKTKLSDVEISQRISLVYYDEGWTTTLNKNITLFILFGVWKTEGDNDKLLYWSITSMKKGETSYDINGLGKIHGWNIIVWAHPKVQTTSWRCLWCIVVGNGHGDTSSNPGQG